MTSEPMDEEMMEIMVDDWLADNAEEMADLKLVGEPYFNNDLDCWCQDAEDADHDYTLTAGEDGNIRINF